jgi:hypothetical protein
LRNGGLQARIPRFNRVQAVKIGLTAIRICGIVGDIQNMNLTGNICIANRLGNAEKTKILKF